METLIQAVRRNSENMGDRICYRKMCHADNERRESEKGWKE